MDFIKTYEQYREKIGDRKTLYRLIAQTFGIKLALYPGSHVDISPSFVIPKVIYIDKFKETIQFFKPIKELMNFISLKKEYLEKCNIEFFGMDYHKKISIKKVDLIISQFAGFVGQSAKKYLKRGGILLCNDSHGDATLAYLDEDYELIGVIMSNQLITSGFDNYFKFKKNTHIDLNKVLSRMKGPNYKLNAENYLFKLK